MAKIYGTPIMAGGGMNKDLPPLLDNFKAFEGGGIDDGLTRLKDLPNGTKVKFGTYNNQTLVWRIAQDEDVTKAVLDLNYDTGKTVIGDMVPSSGSIAGNWGIVGWLNATEAGGSWWANRVKYSDDPPETEPDYSSQDGFLHGWSETDRGLLQNIDWDCNDMEDFEPYKLNSKLIIVANNEGLLAWNGERFCASLGDSPVVTRTYHDPSAAYGGISGMGTSITEGTAYPNESIGIWPVCAPNPEAVVSDEPDDDGGYTISNKRSTVKDLQFGDKIKVAVNPEFQSEFGNYMVFEKVDQDHEGYPENSSTFMAKNITMVRAIEGTYVYNTAMDFSLTTLSQYLNSNAGAGEWFQELIEGQVPPDGTDSSTLNPDYAYADKPGFFNVLDNNFINKLLPTNIEHSTKEVYFFVPSVVEMGVKGQNNETWSSAETISSPFKWFDSDDKRTRALTSEVVSTYPDYKNELMAADESASYEANSPYYYTLRNMLNGNVFPIIRTDGTISPANYVVGKGSCGICPVCNISNDLFLTLQEPDEDGCYIVDYTKIAVTIQADKMEESRAKELAGAVWVYSDHVPKNVNDGTKIQLTREELISAGHQTDADGQFITSLESKSKLKLGQYNSVKLQWYVGRDKQGKVVLTLSEKDSTDTLGRGVYEYDAAEPDNPDNDRKIYGNNRISVSNANQWLNSSKGENEWFEKQHDYDEPPTYQNKKGFLNEWSATELQYVADHEWETIKASVDGGGKETFIRKISLLSTTELGLEQDTGGTEIDIFDSDESRAIGMPYYTRTPYPLASRNSKIVLTAGKMDSYNVNTRACLRPVCYPLQDLIVSNQPDEDGCYTVIGVPSAVTRTIDYPADQSFYVRQFTFNKQKQYQTIHEGAVSSLDPSEFNNPRKIFEYGDTAPANKNLLWIQPNGLTKFWNGSEWTAIAGVYAEEVSE